MTVDLTGLKVITLADIESAVQGGAKEISLAEGAILTPSAKEALQLRGLATRNGSKPAAGVGPLWQTTQYVVTKGRTVRLNLRARSASVGLAAFSDGSAPDPNINSEDPSINSEIVNLTEGNITRKSIQERLPFLQHHTQLFAVFGTHIWQRRPHGAPAQARHIHHRLHRRHLVASSSRAQGV